MRRRVYQVNFHDRQIETYHVPELLPYSGNAAIVLPARVARSHSSHSLPLAAAPRVIVISALNYALLGACCARSTALPTCLYVALAVVEASPGRTGPALSVPLPLQTSLYVVLELKALRTNIELTCALRHPGSGLSCGTTRPCKISSTACCGALT